ncbi:GXWXG domain-containing protein [Streptomyces auratus]|uniref:GXWXG domain-containing protein n=1 Tax=Streptomyces auratus AGR0001 TaxID=1160718 RepID=J2JUU7_9ACTN|nr:GXWXG domain-containing protein [Streptomyces auratus]
MSIEQEVLDVIASGGQCDNAKLAELFDRLEPVDTDLLLGTWQGGGFEHTSENAALRESFALYPHLGLGAVDPQRDVLRLGAGDTSARVRSRGPGRPGTAKHSRPAAGGSR